MPKPAASDRKYVPALDGIRAIAVLSVIAYHVNVPGAGGGMLGVGVFFTLSGYLITDILLGHWRRHGNLGLRHFWVRRARRLLPALFVMLAAVSIWVALFDSAQLDAVRKQVLAAAVYISNWWTIVEHGSYFGKFAAPLPLDHLWSLAIEEQFYVVWPLVVLALIWFLRTRRAMALATLALAGVSAGLMASLFHGGDPTRVYEGTDTRAFGLLIGCALAMLFHTRRVERGLPLRLTRLLDAVGLAGLIGIAALVWGTSTFSSFLYPYGFLLLSLSTVAVIMAVVNPRSGVGAVLGVGALRWVGVRSYGIYLWHWPIVVLANPNDTSFSFPRAAAEVAGTLVVAALSWRFVEEPVRHGALGRLWETARAGAADMVARRHALELSGTAAFVLLLCGLGLGGILPSASAGRGAGPSGAIRHVSPLDADTHKVDRRVHHRRPLAKRTSCSDVVYIGDSTSASEITTEYIPDERQQLAAQMAKVGVKTFYPEIEGARSIDETYQNFPNAPTVAENHLSDGFHGCWVLALGTQDVDNEYDGGIGYAARISRMMKAIHGQPAMWVSVVSLLHSGDSYLERAYNEERMQDWNRTLLGFCKRYPNMRVFDWGAHVKTSWFASDGHFEYDGIHYNTVGNIAKARLTSRGLAHAYPAGAPPAKSCVVS